MPNDLEDYLDPPSRVRGDRKTSGLQPQLAEHWKNLQSEFERAGVRPVIRSGFRTAEQQNALHRSGRPTKGNDGYNKISPHQEGRALDIGFVSGREKGRQIIADYARRNNLHVPSDEPWHIALPRNQVPQQKSDLDSYLDPIETAPVAQSPARQRPQIAQPGGRF